MSAPATHRPFWQAIEAIFDPLTPADAALYTERPAKYDATRRLAKDLRRPRVDRNYRRALIAGTVGNGKTSTLLHLAGELTRGRLVVFLDLWRHFERSVGDVAALDRLEPWELLGLLGLALVRAGEDRFGHRWGNEPRRLEAALARLQKYDTPEGPSVDLVKLASSLAIAAGGALSAASGVPVGELLSDVVGEVAADASLKALDGAADAAARTWRIGQSGRRARQDQEPEVRAVVQAVNTLILGLQRALDRPLVFVIDGLDRIRNEARLEALFIGSSLLAELDCDAVVSGPEFMLHGASQRVRGFDCLEFSNLPVLQRADPSQLSAAGRDFFRDLVARRVAALARPDPWALAAPPDPLPAPVIDHLAYYSGGIVRDFVRLVHALAGEAWEADVPAATRAMADLVLDDLRLWKQQRIHAGEIELLRTVMKDPAHGLPSSPHTVDLLRQQRLLPYPNDNQWYYPHPLLTMTLLK